mgnify:CR=1 FL=1
MQRSTNFCIIMALVQIIWHHMDNEGNDENENILNEEEHNKEDHVKELPM